MKISNKIFACVLLFAYIFLFLYIYFYYISVLLETFEQNQQERNFNLKYIFISKIDIEEDNKNLNETDNQNDFYKDNKITKKIRQSVPSIYKNIIYSYDFLDKNEKKYARLYGQYKNYNKYILLKDIENNIIGEYKKTRYSTEIITTGLYDGDLYFNYKNNYTKIEFNLENDPDAQIVLELKSHSPEGALKLVTLFLGNNNLLI
jgi:hypothetical protein